MDRVVDAALALAAVAAGVLRDLSRVEPIRDPAVTAAREGLVALPLLSMLAVQVVGGLVLLGRRRWPYRVGLVLAALALLHPTFAGLLAPYSVARYGARVPVTLAVNAALWFGALTGARLLELLGSTRWEQGDPYTVGLVALTLTGFGLYLRERSALVQELLARAKAAEAARVSEAAAARLEERLTLAGELHDTASHWVTLTVLQAGALSVHAEDAQVREEAEAIRRYGARAMDELHDLIRVLASEDAAAADQHTSPADLLAELAPGGGVELRVEGHPTALCPASDRTLRRILREALVNARQHAPGADVEVELRYDAQGVDVAVANGAPVSVSAAGVPAAGVPATGVPATGMPAGSGAGLGLATLRRRSELLGGTFSAGPTPDGGFRVEARVPATLAPEHGQHR